MARPRKPPKVPPPEFIKELAEGVGFIIIAASQIEHMLGIALARIFHLTRLQHRALILPMSTTTKSTILRQLGKDYLSKDDRKYLKAFLAELKEYSDHRNDLAHGFYGVKKGKFHLLTFSGDGRLAGQPVSWDAKKLGHLREEMVAFRNQIPLLQTLFPKHLKLPKTRLPTVPPERT